MKTEMRETIYPGTAPMMDFNGKKLIGGRQEDLWLEYQWMNDGEAQHRPCENY